MSLFKKNINTGENCIHCSLPIYNKPITLEETLDKKFCCFGCSTAYQLINGLNSFDLDKIINTKIKSKSKEIKNLKANDQLILSVDGITCSSCSIIIEKIVNKNEGVIDSKVNIVTEKIKISIDKNYFNLDKLKNDLVKFGYKISQGENIDSNRFLSQEYLIKLALVWFLAMNIMSFSFAFYYGELDKYPQIVPFVIWLEAIMSGIVIFVLGYPFIKSSIKKLTKGQLGMETLISIGSITAFVFSFYNTILGKIDVYYDSATMIMAFFLLGKLLETSSKLKANETIKKLVNYGASKTTIIKEEQEVEIDVENIKLNDLVVIRNGSKIPVDGQVISGYGMVDESMLTGESKPIKKELGDKVYSGTINQEGKLIFSAKKIGNDTILAKIINLVENSINNKSESQKLADKISSWFIPIVILISISTFILYFYLLDKNINLAILNSVAVLVVACPCALGLATPMAAISALDKAAKMSIIFKNFNIFEQINKIDTIIFDKTGTLTEGKMTVSKIHLENKKADKKYILKILGSMENYSEHYIGKSITKYVKSKDIKLSEVSEYKSYKGLGISGKFEKKKILIGNRKFLEENNIKINDRNTDNKFTKVYFSVSGKYIGYLLLSDILKNDVKEVILFLKEKGLNLFILSGDNKNATENVANELGIENYFFDQMPEDKINFINNLQKKNKKVMMVGDGINDAPSLVQSDIGVAIFNATDISKEAADINLLSNKFTDLPKIFNLGEKTIRTIKINLLWAFSYNLIAIPLAMFGILKPIIAAAAMSLSSLLIVNNSLRLKREKI